MRNTSKIRLPRKEISVIGGHIAKEKATRKANNKVESKVGSNEKEVRT